MAAAQAAISGPPAAETLLKQAHTLAPISDGCNIKAPSPATPQTSHQSDCGNNGNANGSSSSPSYVITIPSCSAWFCMEEIHETEKRMLPEFFNGSSPALRNPSSYKYFRDSIIGRFRCNPSRRLTFTEARRGLVGDVGSISRVFDFLDRWGLINYNPLPTNDPKHDRTAIPFTTTPASVKNVAVEGMAKKGALLNSTGKLCSTCRAGLSLSYFLCEKANLNLCTGCYVQSKYRPGLCPNDFRRVDALEEQKSEWTDKEILHLLEAALHYGENWKKVAEHVVTRSERDCISQFVRLPFGEQLIGCKESEMYQHNVTDSNYSPVDLDHSKWCNMTPLADTSNPIMAQVAFLSAIVGSDVADAAAQRAIAALGQFDIVGSEIKELDVEAMPQSPKDAIQQAKLQLDEERRVVEKSLSDIMEVQMKDIQDNILHFEKLDFMVERERQQLHQLKDLLFADQLSLARHLNSHS